MAGITLIYGPSKTGKTCALIAAFPRGYFVAQKAALESATTLGIRLHDAQIDTAQTLDDMIALLGRIGQRRNTDGSPVFGAIIGDDLNIVVDRTIAAIAPDFKTRGGARDVRKLFGAIGEKFVELRTVSENVGVPVAFTVHEAPPVYFEGEDEEVKQGIKRVGEMKLRGGPQLPGKMREGMPAVCNHVLRTQKQAPGSSLLPPGYWMSVLRMGAEDPYIVGDRSDTAFDGAPLNMRALLVEGARRATLAIEAPVNPGLTRWPGLEWQDEAVEMLAANLVTYGFAAVPPPEWTKIIDACEKQVRARFKVTNERHVRWAVSDALAAAQYRFVYAQPFKRYGVMSAAKSVF